jgi:hypothetical protein
LSKLALRSRPAINCAALRLVIIRATRQTGD